MATGNRLLVYAASCIYGIVNGNKIGAAMSNGDQRNVSTAQASRAITMRISPGMKTKLDALAESAELPENARRALGQCLAR